MSTCISRKGEFSNHTLGEDFICEDCGAFDEDGVLARLAEMTRDRDHWKAHAEEAGAGFTQVCRDYARATARLAEYERLIHLSVDDIEFRRLIVQHYKRRAGVSDE